MSIYFVHDLVLIFFIMGCINKIPKESLYTTSWSFYQQSDVERIASECGCLELILVKNARHHSCHAKIFLGNAFIISVCFMVEPPCASCFFLTAQPLNLREKPLSPWT